MHNHILQIAKDNKKEIIKLLIVALLAVFVLMYGWKTIIQTDVYQFFNDVYNEFTVKIIINLGAINNHDITFDSFMLTLNNTEKFSELKMPTQSYQYFFVAFVLLLIVPLKQWQSTILTVLFVLLFIAFRAAIISYLFLIYYGSLHTVLLVWIDPMFFIPILFLGLYILQNNLLLKSFYLALEKRFAEILNISLSKLFFLLIVIPPLTRVFLTYLHPDIMPSIVSFILHISKLFMYLVGMSAEVSGSLIICDTKSISLEYPCLGLGVFTLIAVLIISIKGNLKNKIIYLAVFAIIYLVLNALRLSALLFYLQQTPTEDVLSYVKLHDIVTYFMYVVAFVGFLGYWWGLEKYKN